jgi:hypothetical protein
MAVTRSSPPASKMPLHLAPLALTLFALTSVTAPSALAQCDLTTDKIRVDDFYQPDTSGAFYLLHNWTDHAVPGFVEPKEADVDDYYKFTEYNCPTPPGKETLGPPIGMADPTVLQIGSWFYVTGSTDDAAADSNFKIYRTQDFNTFQLHMLAFDPNNLNSSGQQVVSNTLYLNNGKWFTRAWAPQLYMDMSVGGADPFVYMVFTAVEKGVEGPSTNDQMHSCFHVRIRRSKFLQWLSIPNPMTSDGPRFADRRYGLGWQAWHGYQIGNVWHYDGGSPLAYLVPSTATPAMVNGGTCLNTWQTLAQKFIQQPVPPYATYAHGFVHDCAPGQSMAGAMSIDPYVFIDPSVPATDSAWKRIMLYDWDADSGTVNDAWGNHIAAMPVTSAQFAFDPAFTPFPVAAAKNTTNKIFGFHYPSWQWLNNGEVSEVGTYSPWGGVAEGACAFYLPQNHRYYLLYTRNPTRSAAYEIVYRMTEPDHPFTDLALSSWNDTTTPEHLLLRSTDQQRAGGWSFGHCDFFQVLRCGDATLYPYLVFHVRALNPGSTNPGGRTVFFKELTLEDDAFPATSRPASGRLKQLYECSLDPSRDIRTFRIPVCIGTRNDKAAGIDPEDPPGGIPPNPDILVDPQDPTDPDQDK